MHTYIAYYMCMHLLVCVCDACGARNIHMDMCVYIQVCVKHTVCVCMHTYRQQLLQCMYLEDLVLGQTQLAGMTST